MLATAVPRWFLQYTLTHRHFKLYDELCRPRHFWNFKYMLHHFETTFLMSISRCDLTSPFYKQGCMLSEMKYIDLDYKSSCQKQVWESKPTFIHFVTSMECPLFHQNNCQPWCLGKAAWTVDRLWVGWKKLAGRFKWLWRAGMSWNSRKLKTQHVQILIVWQCTWRSK